MGHPNHENFDRMSTEMTGFLSLLHGRTHNWDFQVIWLKRSILFNFFFKFQYHSIKVIHNGRWKHGAAASLGEEQELVFAKLSRYGSVTKHMSPACN